VAPARKESTTDSLSGFHRGSVEVLHRRPAHHGEANVAGLVGLYAKLGRMRVLSSKPVVQSAESIVRKILDAYLEPDKTFVELDDMAIQGTRLVARLRARVPRGI
jgi:hypothetical protein